MKKIIWLVVVVGVIIVATCSSTYAKGRGASHCYLDAETFNTKIDHFIWTIANRNKCEDNFYRYSENIYHFVKDFKKEQLNQKLIKSLIKKHIRELITELRDGEPEYYRAIDMKYYYEKIIFYKKLGFEVDIFETTLQKYLNNQYKKGAEKCIDRINKEGEITRSDINDLRHLLNSSGTTLNELGVSETMESLENPNLILRIKIRLGML